MRDEESGGAARYSGHVEGDTMTLTIVKAKEKIGAFALTRDRHPVLKKCR